MRLLAGGGLEVTWRLRSGVKWSDGRPITAQDLLLARRVRLNEKIESFRKVDGRTMAINWSSPLAQSLKSPGIWPSHVLGKYVTKERDDTEGYKQAIEHMRSKPIPCIGPYRISRHIPKEKIVSEANPHFVGPPPAIERIEEIRYASRAELLQAFKQGEVDITIPNGVTMEDALAYKKENPAAVHIVPSNFLIFLSPDLNHPSLKRLEVRKAILLALDRERLAQAVYGAAGRVAHVPVPGPLPPGAEITPHDPQRARALLDRAGVDQLELQFFVKKSSIDQQIAKLVAADLAKVKVDLEIKTVKSTYKVYKTHKHGGLVLHIAIGMRRKDPMAYWNLPRVSGRYPPTARNVAYTGAIHAMVERDLHAIYPERRRQLRDALFAQFSKRLPNIPLIFAAKRILADPKLRNWQTSPEEYFGSGIERWHFVK
jgi:ABC-type transport system substrate-binding protein